MDIIGINRHHNASVCLLRQGEIIFHLEEERLTRHKRDKVPYFSLLSCLKYTSKIDHLSISGMVPLPKAENLCEDMYTTILSKYIKDNFIWHDLSKLHHESHAACAFYNSGFDKAICIIVDGSGSKIDNLLEMESVFLAEYPAKFSSIITEYYRPEKISVGWMFEAISKYFGFKALDAGKVMGLSAYGKTNPNLPDVGNCLLYDKERFIVQGFNEDFQTKADLAKKLQEHTQKRVLDLILTSIEKTGIKNICLSGGYALNCLANSFYLKHLPKDINLYIEPISSDAGTSIGAAKKIWHHVTEDYTKRKLETLYLGNSLDYTVLKNNSEKFKIELVNYSDVVDLIVKGNIVAFAQGKSEAGPRSLGNRTLLFDPRIFNGKEIVNTVKKRENFRPFAGTILEEDFEEWFLTNGLTSSPFMMYALEVKESKRNLIPSIVHEDGTCRIQTINTKQNNHLYNLISVFKKTTGVPILFNTSLNLAGDPLVETMEDILEFLNNCEVKYLFLPEIQSLIIKR